MQCVAQGLGLIAGLALAACSSASSGAQAAGAGALNAAGGSTSLTTSGQGGSTGLTAGGSTGLGSAGLSGTTAGAGGGTTTPTASGWPAFATSESFQLRRLTTAQYTASVESLLGISSAGMPPIEGVPPVAGFSAVGASSNAVSSAGVGQFENAARFLAQAAFADATVEQTLVPCTPTGVDDAVCFTQFVTEFGRRAFRRPLSADEVTRYTALASTVATSTNDALQGLQATLSAFLQSPYFLYLPEVGEPDPANPGRYRYTGYEMASRLSYFLTGTTPDDALLSAADAGSLLMTDGIQIQTDRLLALPAAHKAVGAFFSGLLSLDSLDSLVRATAVFPQFSATLPAAMKQETKMVIDDLVFTNDGDYRNLFDQHETFVNPELAAFYGVPAPASGQFERITLPESTGRVGLLGQAGVLAVHDHGDATSPTKRGLFVLTRLLCQYLPLAPPANLQIPQPPMGDLTARERFSQHDSNAVCATCHSHTDPVGLSLEHFDALGAYREMDHGHVIDDSGELNGVAYQGLAGLATLLKNDPALLPCLLQSLYSVGLGHLPTEFDRDSFSSLAAAFAANGARIKPLLAALVTSDGFRYLPTPN